MMIYFGIEFLGFLLFLSLFITRTQHFDSVPPVLILGKIYIQISPFFLTIWIKPIRKKRLPGRIKEVLQFTEQQRCSPCILEARCLLLSSVCCSRSEPGNFWKQPEGKPRQTDIRHANLSGACLCERSLNLHEEFLQNQTSAYQSRPFINNTPSKPPSTKVFFRPLSAELNLKKLSGKCLGPHFLQHSDERNEKTGGCACVTGPELQEPTLLGIRLGNQSYLSAFQDNSNCAQRNVRPVVCRIICVCSHQTVGTPRCTLAASGAPSGGAKVESLFVYRFSLSLNSSLAGDLAYFPPVASFTPRRRPLLLLLAVYS